MTVEQDIGENFLKDLCPDANNGIGHGTVDEQTLIYRVLAGDPETNPEWDEKVKKADYQILLCHHLDLISLKQTKEIYRRIPSNEVNPLNVVIYRAGEESDFKISCPSCGQKLWVPDKDENRRGRCPACRKAFSLPSKTELVKNELNLPDNVAIRTAKRGDGEACVNCVKSLVNREEGIMPLPEGLNLKSNKNSTIQIDF